MISDPYFCGETSCGSKRASKLKPDSFAKKLKKADNVLFVLASEVDRYPKDVLKGIIEKVNSTVYKTQATNNNGLDLESEARYGLMEIVDRLCNDENDFDYIVFVGVPYHIETRVLSGLRSYGVSNVATLNWRHQQYADYSFSNMLNPEQWEQSLKEILDEL